MDKQDAGRKWIIKNSKGHMNQVVWLSTLCMANSAIGVCLALVLKEIVDYAVAGDNARFFQMAAGTALMVSVQIMMGYVIRYMDEKSRADLENALKRKVWETLLSRDYASLGTYHTGELMNRLSGDVKVVTDNMVNLVPSVLSMLTRLICALVILVCLDWRFTIVFMAGAVFVMCFSYYFRKIMKQMHKNMQEAEGKLRSFLQEMLESVIIIRSFGAEKRVGEIGWQYMKKHKETRLKKNLFSNFSQTGFSVIMNIGYLFGICWCGYGILKNTISYGTLLAVQQLIGQIQQPIAGIAGVIPRYYTMTASAERLMELEELPEDDGEQGQAGQSTVQNIRRIHINNLTAGYKKAGAAVLEHTGLTISSGDIMAITGESGAGKSTLLKMLLCIYPIMEGTIEIEDESGKKYLLTKGLRHIFAYVPQGNFLMSGTIYEVVSLYGMKGKISVEQACHIACADFVEELPKKYGTELGEKGVGLSEGQMQRLAIARALYMGAPILLLDEATSALDGQTEKQVLENIRGLKDKTVLIVTHRPAALDICSRIVTIQKKQIWEGRADR